MEDKMPTAVGDSRRDFKSENQGAYTRESPLGRWAEKPRITQISRIILILESADGTADSRIKDYHRR
jgi:hypothetical protein